MKTRWPLALGASLLAGAAILTTISLGPSAGAQPAAPPKPAGQCFYSRDWNGWKATPDARTIYLRVNVRDIWRLDLADACPRLNDPAVHLVTKEVTGLICGPLDFDLKVGDNLGPAMPCFVSGLTRLSESEAKTLPKNLIP